MDESQKKFLQESYEGLTTDEIYHRVRNKKDEFSEDALEILEKECQRRGFSIDDIPAQPVWETLEDKLDELPKTNFGGFTYCPSCGNETNADNKKCHRCGYKIAKHYAESEEQIPILASRWYRFSAQLLDNCIIIVIIFGSLLIIPGAIEFIENNLTGGIVSNSFTICLGFSLFLLLQGYYLKTKGQTIGKIIMGTKIVDLNNQVPEFSRLVFLRYGIFYLSQIIPIIGQIIGIVDALFIFGNERRCLHDLLAETRVLQCHKPVKKKKKSQ